jgi:CRP-like cAMP-binding protein
VGLLLTPDVVEVTVTSPPALSAESVQVLARAPLFEGFTPAELHRVVAYMTEQSFELGQVMIWEGQAHRSLFVLLDGRAVVTKVVRGEVESVLARLDPGAHFGELSLIDNRPASGNVTAESDCRVATVPWDRLQRLQSDDPALFGKLAWSMLQDLARKLRVTNRKVQEAVLWGLDAFAME